MSKVPVRKWTDEQRLAITTRGCNLLVSAAAGSGKTAVLTGRVLNRLEDRSSPVDIDRLLVVTFTNAAAAEMRERIASAISSRLESGSGGERLELQLALLNRAKITTIHSFCLDLIKQYFDRLDLDPGFRLADETEAMLLKSDVLEQIFEEKYSAGGEEFARLVECFGGRGDDAALQELVIQIYNFSRINPDPEMWLKRAAGMFGGDGEGGDVLRVYADGVLAEVVASVGGAVREMKKALALCRAPGGPDRYSGDIYEEILMLEGIIKQCRSGWDQACMAFGQLNFNKLKSAGKNVDDRIKDRVTGLRNRVKAKMKKLGEVYMSRTLEEHRRDMDRLAPVIRALAELVDSFAEGYRKAKKARGLLDFSDLEHYCLQILGRRDGDGGVQPSDVALEIREQFEEVLVDEYQDINPVQEAIINMVARPAHQYPNLFMVGDVKQSIYRFRMADPGLFLEKYVSYSVNGEGPGRRINLARNFRSRREIIDAVNGIFRVIMTREAGEMDYDSDAELVFGAEIYEGGPVRAGGVELVILDRRGQTGEDGGAVEGEVADPSGAAVGEDEDLTPLQAEARFVAQRIKDMVESGLEVYDSVNRGYRPVTYRDVVILTRAARGVAAIFTGELGRLGVPAYAEDGSGFYESTEVETMLSLLKVIDNPRQDIPLAAVLRSPVCGLGAGELAKVRMAAQNGDLWDALLAAASAGDEPAPVLASFISNLNRWREAGRRSAMTDLIWAIYRETGYYNYVGAMPGGAQRQANLRALHDRAGQYETTTFRGIFSFLRYIDRMREKGEDPGKARTLGENENVVRIMSIHKSKGLEFPVVVVAGLGRGFNRRDMAGSVLLHRDLGFGPLMVDPDARISYPTLARLAVREKIRREAVAEEMRVLYVAMTRAREKLILTGTVKDLAESARSWADSAAGGEGISVTDVLEAGSYLDWICMALVATGDGSPLVDMATGLRRPDNGFAERGCWSIRFLDARGDTPAGGGAEEPDKEFVEAVKLGRPVNTGGQFSDQVAERLSWVYPAGDAVDKAVKISVTGLGEMAGGVPLPVFGYDEAGGSVPLEEGSNEKMPFLKPSFARPQFLTGQRGLTGAERGTAVHMVMRHLELGGGLGEDDIEAQLDRMREKELLTPEMADSVDCKKIAAFFLSGPGRRMLAAGRVLREAPFSLVVPASEVYPDLPDSLSGERVLVQGVIDCLVDEGDGWLIIDYKTDSRGAGDIPPKYRNQMRLYSRAVAAITGKPVKERVLYFFEGGLQVIC
ncbi:MAG: helicase-exonuclease AddAB subunit AddA [Bacillota bacterium]